MVAFFFGIWDNGVGRPVRGGFQEPGGVPRHSTCVFWMLELSLFVDESGEDAAVLQCCSGGYKEVLALYRWCSKLTAVALAVLMNTEVIVHSAIDHQVQIWNQNRQPGTSSWLLEEPAALLRSLTSTNTQKC